MTDDDASGTTTRVTPDGRVTIPERLREEFDLRESDELRWKSSEDRIVVRKANRSAGRGMLVDGDASDEKREAMAEEMEVAIREKRRSAWTPR